jgi:SAM-dependent methyltransferase
MDPIPSDLAPFYRGGYQKIPRSLLELRRIAARERYRMEPILRYKTGGKLLEIGPWMGIFACNARDAGFDVTAIEIDQNCVDFLNGTVGIRALQSSDPTACLEKLDERFDAIVLWHSLEHLRNPWLVIQQAARHLVVGGILLVAVPNIESYQYAILKSAWRHLDTPRHLFFYPLGCLKQLCSSYNLALLEETTADELSYALSKDGWQHFANSKIPIRYIRRIFGEFLHAVARGREKKAKAGAGLTAIFERIAG